MNVRGIKVTMIHPEATLNGSPKCHGNPPSCSWRDFSVTNQTNVGTRGRVRESSKLLGIHPLGTMNIYTNPLSRF